MLKEVIGEFYRLIPPIKGKGRFAQLVMAPFLRGKGYEVIVDMRNPGGGKLICNLDDLIPWYVYLYGRYQIEKNYEEFFINLLSDKSIVMDIGANIGYYCVQVGNRISGSGHLYAFEPCQYQHDLLNRNIELNSLDNISVMKQIVTNEDGVVKRIYFSGMENTGSSSVEVVSDHYEDVECTTVDAFCASHDLDYIDVVKIDVEGHELGVVKGMALMLAAGKIKHLLLEINSIALDEAGSSAKEIVDYLSEHNYKPHSIANGKKERYVVGKSESLVYFCQ